MEIGREYLEATLANVRQQHDEAKQLVERTFGAILLAEAMLKRLEEVDGVTAGLEKTDV
jgi:hypothetical protein